MTKERKRHRIKGTTAMWIIAAMLLAFMAGRSFQRDPSDLVQQQDTLLVATSGDRIASDVFNPWNGKWHGWFKAYDFEGNERYRLEVTQEYKSAGNGQQSAVFVNVMPDGSEETVHAVNIVRDGKLTCRVRKIGPDGKAQGDVSEHRGTLIGSGHIAWHSPVGEHGFEFFNERVDGDTYWIHGVAVKGQDPRSAEMFEGRYVRVED